MSEYGSRVISAGGKRQIDHKRLVPQLIAQIWAGDYPVFESPAQGGWIYRQWTLQIPQAALGRPYVVFFTLPKEQREVYYFGEPGAVGCIYAPGAVVDAPSVYYFALDYVSAGTERYGRRVWDGAGKLLYDSGTRHLNLQQTLTGLYQNAGYSGREAQMVLNGWATPRQVPAFPAISTDTVELYEIWGDKSGSGEVRARMFYRFAGDALQSIFCRYYNATSETTFNTPFSRINRSNAQNNTVMVIDRWQHDV